MQLCPSKYLMLLICFALFCPQYLSPCWTPGTSYYLWKDNLPWWDLGSQKCISFRLLSFKDVPLLLVGKPPMVLFSWCHFFPTLFRSLCPLFLRLSMIFSKLKAGDATYRFFVLKISRHRSGQLCKPIILVYAVCYQKINLTDILLVGHQWLVLGSFRSLVH